MCLHIPVFCIDPCFHFSPGTFLGVEFLGFGVDICFTLQRIMPVSQSACPAVSSHCPASLFTGSCFMLRETEDEWSGLVFVASVSIARLPKTTLLPQMPLSVSCPGAQYAWWQQRAGLSHDWRERPLTEAPGQLSRWLRGDPSPQSFLLPLGFGILNYFLSGDREAPLSKLV